MKTIAAYAKEMRDFLNESELTERRAFIESFVKEIVVMPGDAILRYTVPMPDDSLIPGRATEKVALNGSVLSTVKNGGADSTIANDLSAGSRTATIHGRIGTAGEGIFLGQTQVGCIIPTSHILLDI